MKILLHNIKVVAENKLSFIMFSNHHTFFTDAHKSKKASENPFSTKSVSLGFKILSERDQNGLNADVNRKTVKTFWAFFERKWGFRD